MKILETITERVFHLWKSLNARNRMLTYREEDRKQMEHVDIPELTEDEYQMLKKTWPFLLFDRKDLYWARLYKKEQGFNPYYLGSTNHCYALRKRINPIKQIHALSNKALSDVYLSGIPFPEVYFRCLKGCLYDKGMTPISMDEAVRILRQKESFVIKPAMSSCGEGVRRFAIPDERMITPAWLSSVFLSSTDSFIVQEVVHQHPDLARLNPTSLNCCRITSVYVAGKYVYAAMLKVGKMGATVDNWHSSYLIGVLPDGHLKDRGWDISLHSVFETDFGIPFSGLKIPFFQEVLSSVEYYHKHFIPQCGIVGWDVTVDGLGSPVVIEANLVVPGIPAEQLCSGPFLMGVHDELCHAFGY